VRRGPRTVEPRHADAEDGDADPRGDHRERAVGATAQVPCRDADEFDAGDDAQRERDELQTAGRET
jgi:hypothetical protein